MQKPYYSLDMHRLFQRVGNNGWIVRLTGTNKEAKISPNARNALGLEIACLVGLWSRPWQRPVEKSFHFFGDGNIMPKIEQKRSRLKRKML